MLQNTDSLCFYADLSAFFPELAYQGTLYTMTASIHNLSIFAWYGDSANLNLEHSVRDKA